MSTRVHASVDKDSTRSKKKKKPDWDATVSDLTIHKLSKEELENRKQKAKSKNTEAAKYELYEKAKASATHERSGDLRTSPRGEQTELHEVLAQSDKALAVVKDLFGDDPVRYTVHPTVTLAPHVTSSKRKLERTIQESMAGGPKPTVEGSPGGIRDESILDLVPRQKAINDPESSPESSSEEEEGLNPESRSYTPSIDLKRFHKFIHEAENKSRTGSERTAPDQSPLQSQGSPAFDSSTGRLSELSTIRPLSDTDQNEHTVESGSTPVPSSEEIRHTLAVPARGQRFASSQHPLHASRKASDSVAAIHHQEAPHSRSECSTTSTGTRGKKGAEHRQGSQLDTLEEMVGKLEAELEGYEEISGRHFPAERPANFQRGTLSGLTASLLTSITKLAHYLKESEVQLKGEVVLRDQLLNTMNDQQNLMEALTTDLVKLQEQNCGLGRELNDLRESTQQQIRKQQEDILDLQNKVALSLLFQPSHYGQHAHSPEATSNRAAVSPGTARNAKSKSHTSTPVASTHLRVVSDACGRTNHATDQGTNSGHPEQSVKASLADQGSKNLFCGQSTKTNCAYQCSSLVPDISCCSPSPPPRVETTSGTGLASIGTAVNDSLALSSMPMSTNRMGALDMERKVHFNVQPETVSTWKLTDVMSRAAGSSKVLPSYASHVEPERSSSFVSQPVVTLSYKESSSRPSVLPRSPNPDGQIGLDTSSYTQTVSLSGSTQGKHLLEIPCVTSSSAHPLCTPSLYPTECAPRPPHLNQPFQLPSLSSFQSSIVYGLEAPQLGAFHHSRNDSFASVSLSNATPLHPSISTQALAESATSTATDTPHFPREPAQSSKEAIPLTYTSSKKTAYTLSPPDLSMSISSVPAERQEATGSQTLPTLEDLQVSMERMSLMAKTVLQDIQREKESLSKHQQKGVLDPGASAAVHEKTLRQHSCAQDGLVPSTAPDRITIPLSASGAPITTNNIFSSDKVVNPGTKLGWFALSSHLAQT